MEENLYDRMRQVNTRRKGEEGEQKQRYQDASRQRLWAIIQRKLKTSFIGAIARFETFFGEFWGHGLALEECTEEQVAERTAWEECRTEILNNGNNQLRALEAEIEQYIVDWQRYRAVLGPKPKEKENEQEDVQS